MDHRINIMEILSDSSVGWFCSCNEMYDTLDQLCDHIRKETACQEKRLAQDLIIIHEHTRSQLYQNSNE